jgi:hypothetical protein
MLINDTKGIAEFNGFFGQLPCDWAEHIELDDVYVTEENDISTCKNKTITKLYYYDVVVARSNMGSVDDDLYEELINFISATIADNYVFVQQEEPTFQASSIDEKTKAEILKHLQVMREELYEFDANETVGLLIEIDNLATEVEEIECN